MEEKKEQQKKLAYAYLTQDEIEKAKAKTGADKVGTAVAIAVRKFIGSEADNERPQTDD